MVTLTIRISDDDLEQIKSYADEKKIPQSAAIRELIRSALKFEAMKKEGGNANNEEEENLKKLTVDAAAFSIEGVYILRELLPILIKSDNGSAEIIREVAKRTSRDFVKNRMKIASD